MKRFPDIATKNGGMVETWYDRSCRSWCSRLIDRQKNQIGDAHYDGTRTSVKFSRADLVSRGGGVKGA